jgi:Holliday junction resolvase RusA-like endonuclease
MLRIIIPFIPPTSNKIYVTDWRRKRRFKSRQANAFQHRFMREVVPVYLPWLSQLIGPETDPSVVYSVFVYFYLDKWDILNKTWGAKKSPAKTRYKKMDLENRFKLLHDCLSKATGIDDCHFFSLGGQKMVASAWNIEPQVHIFLSRADPMHFGIGG